MLKIARTTKFKSDIKKLIKSGNFSDADHEKLLEAIQNIARDQALDPKYKDHPLSGNWKKYRECHIKPDLLFIYKIEEKILKLVRVGSHSELFS